jgi:hypothetical protein
MTPILSGACGPGYSRTGPSGQKTKRPADARRSNRGLPVANFFGVSVPRKKSVRIYANFLFPVQQGLTLHTCGKIGLFGLGPFLHLHVSQRLVCCAKMKTTPHY